MRDRAHEPSSYEVSNLKKENEHLKQLVAEIALKNRVLIPRRPSTPYSGIYPIEKILSLNLIRQEYQTFG